jgi:hypothetical protein
MKYTQMQLFSFIQKIPFFKGMTVDIDIDIFGSEKNRTYLIISFLISVFNPSDFFNRAM